MNKSAHRLGGATIALLALSLAPRSFAQAADPHAGMEMPGSPTDDAPAMVDTASYLQMASSGDQFEIQSSQLALQMSRDSTLQAFARTLIDDHTRLSTALATAARGAGMNPPAPALSAKHMQMIDALRASAGNFDTTYRQQQVVAHAEALGLHRSYATSGTSPALKSAAAAAVPVIERHLQQAQTMAPGGSPAPTSPQPAEQPPSSATPAETSPDATQPSAQQRAGERG